MSNNKALFTIAITDALNEIGDPTLELVDTALMREYRCSIADCLSRPEYLKNILNQIFGYAASTVIIKIKECFGDFGKEKDVKDFLEVLTQNSTSNHMIEK
ncbi:MAG: hypothetical protein HY223_02510 [Thaumarchaeota archaeon]|nr:hypothetical protein [Nitrososphaerota archaeon]MBI3639165.1 hypothetical protein [Nitrososphaerota archaeon]